MQAAPGYQCAMRSIRDSHDGGFGAHMQDPHGKAEDRRDEKTQR